MKIFSAILLVCFVVFATAFSGCRSSGAKEKATATHDSDSAHTYEVFRLEKGRLSSFLKLPGELAPFQQVDLYSKVNSFVKKLFVDVGSEVKQGQLLATMEAPEINAQLSGASSRLESAEAIYIASKAHYERLLETSKTPGTISPNDLDMALAKQQSDLAQWRSAQAAYREITDNKSYLEMKAPFSGVISARNVSAGAYVGPAGKGSDLPVFTLQEQEHLRLIVSIPEAFTGYLKQQDEVRFTIKSLPGEKFTARVSRLAGALDGKLRSERVEMDVMNTDKRLLPGMVAEIMLTLTSRDSTFLVPESAIVNTPEKVFIIKVDSGKALWIPVVRGREGEGLVEVYGDLQDGDLIIRRANEEVRDGSEAQYAIKEK
ncbi:MAG: efflux RND transporter periplasmic adaptor subunit [Chitinophagaceae bacterium]|nr:efflux RND transporter periplasmic adaptor subunit [Chitinophagaceae bacterium]